MSIIEKLDLIQASIAQGGAIVSEVKSEVEVFGQQKYDEGFAAGVASVGAGAIYSQEQLDQAVLAAKAELKAQIKAKYEAAQAAESSIEQALLQELGE
ncbi:MAG: hypothetical protein BWZ03_00709 [bacterium ADurb.BinA186]|nr:MAG: hypothetical protein BWZ03_00709 [bacterium ADurb.BinA186]